MLYELFPRFKEAMQTEIDTAYQQGQIDALRDVATRPVQVNVTQQQAQAVQIVETNVPQIAAPPTDDDEFDLVVKCDTSVGSANTFLDTVQALVN